MCCAAFLALSGIGLTMLVDNPLIEVVKMAPLGMLVGLAAGMATAEAEEVATLPTTAEPQRGAVLLSRAELVRILVLHSRYATGSSSPARTASSRTRWSCCANVAMT